MSDTDAGEATDLSDDELGEESPAPTAHDVLEYLVRSIVEHPDQVEIEADERGERVQLSVQVADTDMGRVIGKRGRVANAIRTVVAAAAVRDGVTLEVEFLD